MNHDEVLKRFAEAIRRADKANPSAAAKRKWFGRNEEPRPFKNYTVYRQGVPKHVKSEPDELA